MSCVNLGVLLAAASGFLAYWEHAAHGAHDIAARGGLLLFMLLPWILAVSWFIVAGLTVQPLRRSGFSWWGIFGISVTATLVAAALEFLPPLLLLARALSSLPTPLRPTADFALAGVLVMIGLAVVRRGVSSRPATELLHPTSARGTSI